MGLPARAAPCLFLLLAGCGACAKSDAERAAEERVAIEARIRDSNLLVPYRALKLTLRAQGEQDAPEAVGLLFSAFAETRGLPDREMTAGEARRAAESYLRLAIAFHRAKSSLRERDEDEYPFLWTRWLKVPPLFPGYDAGQEHLLLGALWWLLDLADKGDRVPATEVALYELSRARPTPAWPAELRTFARGARGLSFCEAGYHYAAEEELSAYLAEVEGLSPAEARLFAARGASGGQSRDALLAIGHFSRAYNRLRLKREDAATTDLEAGLGALQRLGVENELTWWGWSFVHARRGRYEEAAQALERLAESAYVEDAMRPEIRASAAELRQHREKLPVFLEARAFLVLARALIARAGGTELLLAAVVGPELAEQIHAPLLWADRVRSKLAGVDAAEEAAAGALEKVKGVGAKGLEALEKLRAPSADQPAE